MSNSLLRLIDPLGAVSCFSGTDLASNGVYDPRQRGSTMHRSLSPGRRPASAAYERFLMSSFTAADKAAPPAVLLSDNRAAPGRQPNLFHRLAAPHPPLLR